MNQLGLARFLDDKAMALARIAEVVLKDDPDVTGPKDIAYAIQLVAAELRGAALAHGFVLGDGQYPPPIPPYRPPTSESADDGVPEIATGDVMFEKLRQMG